MSRWTTNVDIARQKGRHCKRVSWRRSAGVVALSELASESSQLFEPADERVAGAREVDLGDEDGRREREGDHDEQGDRDDDADPGQRRVADVEGGERQDAEVEEEPDRVDASEEA